MVIVKQKSMSEYLYHGASLVAALLLCACQQKQPQKEYDYHIVADLEGCTQCEVRLSLKDSTSFKRIDSVVHANGRFALRGKITQPGFYQVWYHSKTDITVSGSVDVYLPTDSVHIKATKNSIRPKLYRNPSGGWGSYLRNTIVYSAAPQQKQWEQYLLVRDSLWQKFFTDKALATAKFTQTFGAGNPALTDQWADTVNNFNYRVSGYWAAAADWFVNQHPASEVALYAMLDNRNDRPAVERFRRYYRAMPPALQASFYGRMLDQELARSETRSQNSQRLVGTAVGSLAGKSPAGKGLDAGRLFKQHKLTLVVFWASWCGPCRMELPKFRRLYRQYNRQGFSMVGVSLDISPTKWRQAIAEDSLQMPQLSELKGVQGDDIRRFGVTAIPANLLVNSQGTIVAVDVPFPKLQKQLQQTL